EPHRELARDRARAGRRFRPLRARDRRRDRGMTAALPAIAGVPIDFILFAAVLAGVALFHHHTLRVALIGLVLLTAYKVAFAPFHGIAAIVAASNAGGSGSVVGDTTTTMMWIAGVPPKDVFEAYVAALPALLIFGVIAARQQQALQPITKDPPAGVRLDGARIAIVVI